MNKLIMLFFISSNLLAQNFDPNELQETIKKLTTPPQKECEGCTKHEDYAYVVKNCVETLCPLAEFSLETTYLKAVINFDKNVFEREMNRMLEIQSLLNKEALERRQFLLSHAQKLKN